jgi:hypothetical protein
MIVKPEEAMKYLFFNQEGIWFKSFKITVFHLEVTSNAANHSQIFADAAIRGVAQP